MGAHIVQDSDAESSDSSPLRGEQTEKPVPDGGDGEALMAARFDCTTVSKVHSAWTTMDIVKRVDRAHAEIRCGEKRQADTSTDEDELVLVPHIKRTKRPERLGSSSPYGLLLTVGASGQDTYHSVETRESGDQLADELGQDVELLPRTPRLVDDLSFSSLVQSTITYDNSQQSGRGSRGKWFPALDTVDFVQEIRAPSSSNQDPKNKAMVLIDQQQLGGSQSLIRISIEESPPKTFKTVEVGQVLPEPQPTEPVKRKRGRPRKVQDQAAGRAEAEATEAKGAKSDASAKSRGKKRGRKPKNRTPTPCIDSEEEDVVVAEQEAAGVEAEAEVKPNEALETAELAPKEPDENKENEAAPATVSPKRAERHSPIRNGKVPYRVGLSKRARIEPLLRIVRK